MKTDLEFAVDAASDAAQKRFLIIDDSLTMRRIIANILGRLGFAEARHAGNGREALDRLAAEQVDVIITDWYMPEMNGLEFVRALRATPATSHIPILIVTANAASDDIEQAIQLGVNGYILKPFTVETMRDKIMSVLGLSRTPADLGLPGPHTRPKAPEAQSAPPVAADAASAQAAPTPAAAPQPVAVAAQAPVAAEATEPVVVLNRVAN